MAAPLWVSTFTGERTGSQLKSPRPIHGATDDAAVPIWIDQGGKRLRVARKINHFNIHDDLWHQGICGCCWIVELADGSTWRLVRDLIGGGWLGERVDA